MSLFKPKEKISRFTQFDPLKYRSRGFKAVLIDVDNTITLPDIGFLTREAKAFIDEVKKAGLIPIIFSNNNKERVKSFVSDYQVKWCYYACKPLPFAFWIQCLKLHIKPKEVIVLGDQLLTDILGANLSGCYGIYSKQLSNEDTAITAKNRKIEKYIWSHILHEEV